MVDTPPATEVSLPSEVQIEVNDNTTAYNHNVAIRLSDGSGKTSPEELSKIAMDRIKEMREIIKNDSYK
jgi:anti-sigma28 factor (negative regulator of flagellin synthesis)